MILLTLNCAVQRAVRYNDQRYMSSLQVVFKFWILSMGLIFLPYMYAVGTENDRFTKNIIVDTRKYDLYGMCI